MPEVTVEELQRIDIRAGTVVRCEAFPEARNPAYKLWIDLGPEIGERRSSARITDHYEPEGLVGRQVAAVVNLPTRRIGPFSSEVLVLGFYDDDGTVVLVRPDRSVPNGARLG
ncbi:MAG TPA: tRNA-binding protein [Actinomycetota bacterium]